MLLFIGRVICYASMAMGIFCWFSSIYFHFRMVTCTKSEVPFIFRILSRPLNWDRSCFTERGLIARKWCILSMVGFLICWTIGVLVGIATGVSPKSGPAERGAAWDGTANLTFVTVHRRVPCFRGTLATTSPLLNHHESMRTALKLGLYQPFKQGKECMGS